MGLGTWRVLAVRRQVRVKVRVAHAHMHMHMRMRMHMPYSVKNINAAKAHGWRTVLVGTTDRDSGLPLQVSTTIVSIAIVRTAKV